MYWKTRNSYLQRNSFVKTYNKTVFKFYIVSTTLSIQDDRQSDSLSFGKYSTLSGWINDVP
jgi:hypothetical protein